MSYLDYKRKVREHFLKSSGLSEKDADKYLSSKENDEIIREDYDMFSGKNIANISPDSTAHTLWLLY